MQKRIGRLLFLLSPLIAYGIFCIVITSFYAITDSFFHAALAVLTIVMLMFPLIPALISLIIGACLYAKIAKNENLQVIAFKRFRKRFLLLNIIGSILYLIVWLVYSFTFDPFKEVFLILPAMIVGLLFVIVIVFFMAETNTIMKKLTENQKEEKNTYEKD